MLPVLSSVCEVGLLCPLLHPQAPACFLSLASLVPVSLDARNVITLLSRLRSNITKSKSGVPCRNTAGRSSLVIPSAGNDDSGWIHFRDSIQRVCQLEVSANKVRAHLVAAHRCLRSTRPLLMACW